MYKLYNVKTWGSLAIHCLLEELEAPYTNIWMTREQVREPEFRAISPLGMIPSLGLADGRTLYESAAIVSFLIAAHPEKNLSPPLGSADYGEFMTLLHLMSTEIYALGNIGAAVDEYVAAEAERQAMRARISRKVDDHWMIIEKRLATAGPWLMGVSSRHLISMPSCCRSGARPRSRDCMRSVRPLPGWPLPCGRGQS